MKRWAIRISTVLSSVLAVGVLGASLAWAHPIYPDRPAPAPVPVPVPDGSGTNPGTETPGAGNTPPGTEAPGAGTNPGTEAPGAGSTAPGNTTAGNTAPGNSGSGNTAPGGSGQPAGGPTSATTDGGGKGGTFGTTDGGGNAGPGTSGATNGGDQQAGRGPGSYTRPAGVGGTQTGIAGGAPTVGPGASLKPATVRTRSGQVVLGGSVGSDARGRDRGRTGNANAWSGSRSAAPSALSPTARQASASPSAGGTRLVFGAAIFGAGLVAILAGFLVAEVSRRRARTVAQDALLR